MYYFKIITSAILILGTCNALLFAEEKKDPDLIGYWAFNEGKGETTKDLSGNGNPGTIVNGKWVTNGASGSALKFNGVDTYVDFGSSKLFDFSKNYTISIWLKIGDTKKGLTLINKGGWSKGWQFYISRTFMALTSRGLVKPYPVYYRRFVYGKLKENLFLSNPFYNIVLTSKVVGEKTEITFYVNGKKGKSFLQPGGKLTVNSFPLTLGKYASAEAGFFSGIMDEVKIYKRALTDKEIKREYDKLEDE